MACDAGSGRIDDAPPRRRSDPVAPGAGHAPALRLRRRAAWSRRCCRSCCACWPFPTRPIVTTSKVSLVANVAAVVIATWIRLSVGTFPGTRSGTLIAPAIAAAHGIVLALLLMTRLPYDRLGILTGFVAHLVWAIGLHLAVHRRVRRRFAVVPFGHGRPAAGRSRASTGRRMRRPVLAETADCDALVADFAADLPDEWEAFLADAALAGRIVYQVKQLSESLTGRVEIAHLSENSFGSLLPARGYFHLKAVVDFFAALLLVPSCSCR